MLALTLILTASPELIVPGEAVGPLRRDMSEAQLTRAVGAENVRPLTVTVEAGRCARGSIVFPDDPFRRMEIVWSHDRPARVILRTPSRYHTQGGVRIGATLAEL